MEVLTRLVAQARAVEVGLHLNLVEVLIRLVAQARAVEVGLHLDILIICGVLMRLVAQARAVEVRLHSNYVGFDFRFLETQDMDT